MDNAFHESIRYDYPLTPESIVLDCGGYEGRFAETLVNRYGCTVYVYEPIHRFHEALVEKFKGHPKIKLFNHGVAGTSRVDWFCIKGDMTGKFADTGDEQVVWLRDIRQIIVEIGKPIALLKLNIEGLEYEVLERLMESLAIDAVQNIQVQCHGTPGFERYEAIREKLLWNHELTFDFPFCWQNFRQKLEALGCPILKTSASQAGQDTFAREAIGGDGYFLDIGCSHPEHLSNTALLEGLGWRGMRMDVQPVIESRRNSPVVVCDAMSIYWPQIIADHSVPSVVDYLSLDIDGGTLKALRNLLPHVRFKVATVEHDYYRLGHGMKDDIRHEMKMAGYSLLCANVCHEGFPFEDWWIDEAYFRPKVAVEVKHEYALDTYFDKILVINLDRRPDRWDHCLAEFLKHGIRTAERFPAHDLGPDDGNRGCTASHRAVLEIIAYHKWPRVLVLEDDFEIVHENFGYLFAAAIINVQAQAPDWDMLYLGGGYGSKPQARLSPHVIRVDTMMTTSSYGITWQQARKMAPHIAGVGPIDSLYGAFNRADKCYCIQPRLMAQYTNYSDLQNKECNNRMSMLDPAHEKLV